MSVNATIKEAFNTVTDWRTGKNSDLTQVKLNRDSNFETANGAIAIGDVCVHVVPTATQAPRVNKSGAAAGGWTVMGVACTVATAAGREVELCTEGYCLVNVGATAPVAGDVCIVSATAGQADVIVQGTGVVAATVAGTVLGYYLGTKDASNLAFVYFRHF